MNKRKVPLVLKLSVTEYVRKNQPVQGLDLLDHIAHAFKLNGVEAAKTIKRLREAGNLHKNNGFYTLGMTELEYE